MHYILVKDIITATIIIETSYIFHIQVVNASTGEIEGDVTKNW